MTSCISNIKLINLPLERIGLLLALVCAFLVSRSANSVIYCSYHCGYVFVGSVAGDLTSKVIIVLSE